LNPRARKGVGAFQLGEQSRKRVVLLFAAGIIDAPFKRVPFLFDRQIVQSVLLVGGVE
jgi:hypothetical protein